MLKDNTQMTLDLSPYQGLYDAIIPGNHILRKLKDNIDFSFVNPMLRKQYCEHFGRPAKEPEMMFKLLFLKKLYDLSDERLISSAQTDIAYVSDENLEVCEKEAVTLYARTNSAVAAAANTELEEGFSYSKDAHMLQCPAGHLAMRADYKKASNGNTYAKYCFSAKTCPKCPLREQCKVGKSKTHTYNITQPNAYHKARLEFESSGIFKKKLDIRHRIEEKNGEMKTAHGFQRADSVGLVAMR